MKTHTTDIHTNVYPLETRFQKRVMPWLLLCTVILITAIAWGGRHLIIGVYLDRAGRDAHALIDSLIREGEDSTQAWFAIFDKPVGSAASANLHPADWARVNAILAAMEQDRALPKLKIYDLQGVVRYSSDPAGIGRVERTEGLDEILRTHSPAALRVNLPDGPRFELYTYLPGDAAEPPMIVEVYESSDFLDHALLKTLLPAAMLPALVLVAIMVALRRMVGTAQRQLDAQREDVQALQFRLEKLVSNRAASAARNGPPSLIGGHLTDVTLYFSDVRDFTSYAETHRPEHVVELLNRLISIQVAIIDRLDGEVDKIIGDAVLAVFTGADRAARAIVCAQEVLTQCAQLHDLPRKLAIGVHDGAVVAGVIGAADRQDYTVIGDAVNVSQRLCTLAQANELVSDIHTLQRAGHPDAFGTVEEQTVKGRQEALRVRRWEAKG